MNIRASMLTLFPACALVGCTTTEPLASPPIAIAPLVNGQGQSVGSAELLAKGSTVTLAVSVSGMPSGTHGIHLHATGKCEGPGFTTAAGHLNPTGHEHGSMNPAGPHMGDLPNLEIAASGTGSVSIPLSSTPAVLREELFDADGTAIVIHAGPDDYKTDPSGNSGGRIACGVFTRP